MSMKRMKHLLVLCLALVMVVGLLSVTALAVDDDLSITVQEGAEPTNGGGAVTLSGEPSKEDLDPVMYTVAGSLYVNGENVGQQLTRYAGPEGDPINFAPMIEEAEALALVEDAANKPVRAEAAVYYPGSDKQPAANSTYGGEGFNWQEINGKYITYFAVNATTYYNVSFISDDSIVETQEVVWNGTATEPAAPTKNGYKFVSWCTEDGIDFDFRTPITRSITLYAKWEEDIVYPVPANCYVEANFPSKLLIGTYRDVSLSIWEDAGLPWQENATLYVEVDGPAYSDADLWYYDSDAGYWFDGKYVDTVRLGQVPGTWTFNETGVTIPLSLYLDRAGTYDFTFTLKADDGTVLATDTATVRAYTETHDDYRIYLDCGRHGSISTSPSTWADYRDTVTIYVNPIRAMSWTPCGSTTRIRTASASTPTIAATTPSPCPNLP